MSKANSSKQNLTRILQTKWRGSNLFRPISQSSMGSREVARSLLKPLKMWGPGLDPGYHIYFCVDLFLFWPTAGSRAYSWLCSQESFMVELRVPETKPKSTICKERVLSAALWLQPHRVNFRPYPTVLRDYYWICIQRSFLAVLGRWRSLMQCSAKDQLKSMCPRSDFIVGRETSQK